jgi:UDP-glucose 4-epimerase
MAVSAKKILVTGGAGFIGSFVVEALVRDGWQVTVLDNFRSGLRENLAAVEDDIELVEGSILDHSLLLRLTSGKDAISHQAAQLEITRAIEDPIEDLQTNTEGTLNVFRAAVEAGVGQVVFASSAGVYGQAVETPQHEDSHPTEPNWAYGVSKLATEKYATIYRDMNGLRTTALRYGIVYGPREWYGRVLTIFLKRALEGQSLVVFGDGEQVRDFVHVDDVVDMNLRSLTDERAAGEIFNVASAVGTTINELAQLVTELADGDLETVHEDVAEGASSQYYDRIRLPMELKTLVQSYEKAERLVGWRPTIALRDGLRTELDWLRDHPDRWQRMTY